MKNYFYLIPSYNCCAFYTDWEVCFESCQKLSWSMLVDGYTTLKLTQSQVLYNVVIAVLVTFMSLISAEIKMNGP